MGSLSSSDSIEFSSTSTPSESLDEFLARWGSDIERAARHYCRMGAADTDDVAQKIRLRLFQAWLAHGGAPPVGYLRKTIRNTALNAIRDDDRAAHPGLRDDLPDEVVSGTSGAERYLAAAEDRRHVKDWVGALPPHLAQTFDLLYGRELSQRDAATEMGLSQPRIAQLHRALLERGREDLSSL